MIKVKSKLSGKTSLEIARQLSRAALNSKAENLIILDVGKLSGFADYFVIMIVRSSRHVQGIASAVDQELSGKRLKSSKTEGLEEGHWVLLDFEDVIVHIFYHETRELFDLEGLWHDAPRIKV